MANENRLALAMIAAGLARQSRTQHRDIAEVGLDAVALQGAAQRVRAAIRAQRKARPSDITLIQHLALRYGGRYEITNNGHDHTVKLYVPDGNVPGYILLAA